VNLTGGTALRIACDPIVVAERARNIRRGTSALVQDATELDLPLLARRRSEPALRPVIDLLGFCARDVRYNPFGRDDWIRIRIPAFRQPTLRVIGFSPPGTYWHDKEIAATARSAHRLPFSK